MNLAGLPPTTFHASKVFATIEFAEMTQPSPIETPGRTVTPVVNQQQLPILIGFVIRLNVEEAMSWLPVSK